MSDRKRTRNVTNQIGGHEVTTITEVVWERSYDLGFYLRRKGLTEPTVDPAVALENTFIFKRLPPFSRRKKRPLCSPQPGQDQGRVSASLVVEHSYIMKN
ncbi:MAG: hypothetical protein ACE5HO_21180 [bacterium]